MHIKPFRSRILTISIVINWRARVITVERQDALRYLADRLPCLMVLISMSKWDTNNCASMGTITQVSGQSTSPIAGGSSPVNRQNSPIEASLRGKCSGTLKRLPTGLVQEIIREQAALRKGVEAVEQSPPGLALNALNSSPDASSYAAVAARSPVIASVSSEGASLPRSQGPDVDSFGIGSRRVEIPTEELKFDILPTIEISARSIIFINRARSNGRTIMDWLKGSSGPVLRTTEEDGAPQVNQIGWRLLKCLERTKPRNQ